MRTVVLAAALGLVASQPVPLPATTDYLWRAGSLTAQVVVEAHVDLLCPDCAAAWPVLKSLQTAYAPSQVELVLHSFPLPYHTWAFTVAQGANVIASLNTSTVPVFQYIDALFGGAQQNFWNAAVAGNSSMQVDAALAQFAASTTGVDATAFLNGLADPNLNMNTRISWKYGCSRSVTGTPSFFVNGLPVDADSTWTLADWQNLLNPLFGASSKMGATKQLLGRTRRAAPAHVHATEGRC